MCLAGRSSQSSWAIYLMEGTLLAFGAFLAWETRHVTFAALNDSREIGLCLYNVVLLSAVGLTLSLLLDEQEVVLYGFASGCIIIGTTLTQLIVFIPKVRAVYYGIDGTEATVPLPGTSSHVFQSRKSVSGSILKTTNYQPRYNPQNNKLSTPIGAVDET